MKYIITIGREYGSGGHFIGKLLAERLGISFYDNELLLKKQYVWVIFYIANSEDMPALTKPTT